MSSSSPTARRYGGQSAETRVAERRARLLEAALELMGTRGAAGTTIRGVAEESGLAARYVYESFPTIDELQIAVFDEVINESLEHSLLAFAAAPQGDDRASRRARSRAVLAATVDLLLDDPRKGRVLMIEAPSSPVLAPRVQPEMRRFAGMLAASALGAHPTDSVDAVPDEVHLVARFLTGGVSHTIGAALQGDLDVDRGRLVDLLVALFEAVERSSDVAELTHAAAAAQAVQPGQPGQAGHTA